MIRTTTNIDPAVVRIFRQRRIFRFVLVVLAVSGIVIAVYNEDIGALIGLLFVAAGIRLLLIESVINVGVWDSLQAKLQLPTKEQRAQDSQISTELGGVMGSIGDVRSVTTLAHGYYQGYYVKLMRVEVTYKPKSKHGTYSRKYRVFQIMTKQDHYHVFLDSISNSRNPFFTAMSILSDSLVDNRRLSVEGDVNKYFRIYVPKDSRADSLVTLTPDKLMALRTVGKNFDVEFVDTSIYVITSNKLKGPDDVAVYTGDLLRLVDVIGVNLNRTRGDITKPLTVRNTTVVTF